MRKHNKKKATKKKRVEAIKSFGERRERRKKRDNGEKKDSDHADYGRTQQTGKAHQTPVRPNSYVVTVFRSGVRSN